MLNDRSIPFSVTFLYDLTRHENGASRCGQNLKEDRAMDLHNNAIGRAIYDANAWNSQKCVGISFGWFNIRYCYDRGASKSYTDFANIVEQKARQSIILNLISNPALANNSAYSNTLIRYR